MASFFGIANVQSLLRSEEVSRNRNRNSTYVRGIQSNGDVVVALAKLSRVGEAAHPHHIFDRLHDGGDVDVLEPATM